MGTVHEFSLNSRQPTDQDDSQMIHFFRRLRQTLLADNPSERETIHPKDREGKYQKPASPVGRYALYAIGEILLVVLGILIALQINNWNTNRIERTQEQQILKQLKEEYLDNKAQLQSKINVRKTMMASAFKLIDYQLRPDNKSDIDSLNILLMQTMFRPTFDPALGVTNELINSGKLYLLGNPDLRKSISNWSGKYYNELDEEEQVVMNYILNDYYPFIVKNYSIRNVLSQIGKGNLWKEVHLSDAKESELYSAKFGNDQIDDPSELLSNPDLNDHLFTLIGWNDSANNQSKGVMEKMNEILDMIEAEIENK